MNRLNALCIDPGTKAGFTIIKNGKIIKTGLWKNAVKPPNKNRARQPKYHRLSIFFENIRSEIQEYFSDEKSIWIVIEGAAAFQRGKAAVEASHKFRAVVELIAGYTQRNTSEKFPKVKYKEIQPNDLKQFALGKRSGDKPEMIDAAQKLGYEGNDDNEADSYLIANWALKHCK